jgi:hypothetical protein
VVGKDVVAIVTLTPSGALVSQSELAKELLGDNASQVTIAGQPAWHGSLGQGTVGSLWMRKPLIIVTWGFDLSATDNVLAGIVAAQPTQ